MPNAAGVCGCTHVAACTRPVGAVSGNEVDVLVIGKMCQLIKADKVIGLALIVELVL